MPELLIVIPVLGRPQRAQPVYESAATTNVPHRVLFLCSPGDDLQRAACLETGADVAEVEWEPGPGDWARKIEAAIAESEESWIFTGADDLRFHDGWASEALRAAARTGCRVIGTNDLGNPAVKRGNHSTHSLVARSYVEQQGTIDGVGLFHLGYSHNFSDTEMVETAKARGEFAFAAESVVEHLHPDWLKAERDATYERGKRHFTADRRLFNSRRRLWT